MTIKKLFKKIAHLTAKVGHLKGEIRDLHRRLNQSVSNVVYDRMKSELNSAVNNTSILTREITTLGKELTAAQSNLANDAKKIGKIGTLVEQVAPLVSEIDLISVSLQRDLKLIGDLPAELKSARHGIVSTAADLAPGIAARAEQMATRLNALEILSEAELKEIAKDLESLRELGRDVVGKVGTLFDESLPETAGKILSSLSKTITGDGQAFQQSFIAAIEDIEKSLQELCTMHHLPFPVGIQSHVTLIKKYTTQAPTEVFDVLAVLMPIDQLRDIKKSLEKASPHTQSPEPNDPASKSVPFAEHVRRDQAKKKKNDKKSLSKEGAEAMVSVIAISSGIVLLLSLISNAFPVSVAATQSWGVSAHEDADVGGDAGASAEGGVCVVEGVSAALSSTFLSLMPLLVFPLSGFFSVVIYVLEFTLGLIEIEEEG